MPFDVDKFWTPLVNRRISRRRPTQMERVPVGSTPAPARAARIEGLESRILFAVADFNFSNGFTASGVFLDGCSYSGTKIQLANSTANSARSAFYASTVPISSFSTDFTFQLSSATDSGFTFAIQDTRIAEVGANGAGLGYSKLAGSAAVEFNISNGATLTGLGTNGSISTPTDLSASHVDFHTGDVFQMHIAYDGKTLAVREADTATLASATQSYGINLPSVVGSSQGYIGFTSGTAASGMVAMVDGWSYTDDTKTPDLGVNIRRLRYDSGDELFADAMKEPGVWSTNLASPDVIVPPTPASVDGNGWPRSDAGIEIIDNQSDDGGTYALSFVGQATVAPIPAEPDVQVVNQAYDAASNTTTAQVLVPAGANALMLDFTHTQRLASDSPGTGVTNVQLMRPISPDSTTTYPPTTLFTTPIQGLLSKFTTIRYMDFTQTNYNPQVNWSDRTRVDQIQSTPNGGAWEYAVALANQTGEDMWINIPALATDSYITSLAELINFGSDGVNSYTGPKGSAVSAGNPNPVPAAGPVWAGLNPTLRVYVEYSNEVWNYSFAQASENLHAAVAEVATGSSPLNYDGDGSENDWAIRRTVEQTVNISAIFRSVFTSSMMMSRIRPVYQWQYANSGDTAAIGLQYLDNYYNNADGLRHVANPHPPDYYFWGGGGAWYGGLANSSGLGQVTVSDANFSMDAVTGYQQDPTGSSWAFTGTAGIAANGSSLGNPNAVAGTQAAYIQGGGSFSETVNFTGGLAALSFSAAFSDTESFTVSIDGKDVSTPWTPATTYGGENTAAFDTGASAGPHTVTFTGVSGAGSVFISGVAAETANAMYASGISNITSTIQSESAWANAFGLHEASYEGGFDFGVGYVGTPLQIAANQDSRAEQAALAQMDEYYAAGGELGMYYDTTNHIWALTLDINKLDTPKLKAVTDLQSSPTPTLTLGTTLPTPAGASVSVANLLSAYQGAAGLYALDATTLGTYQVTLAGMAAGAEQARFLLDGQVVPGLAFVPTASSGTSSPALTFTINTPGLHTLLLTVTGSGSITPGNPAGAITVTRGAAAPLRGVPKAPVGLVATASGMTQVNLSWTTVPSAVGYRIERSLEGVNYAVVGYASSASYVDSTVAPGATYHYVVLAYDAGGFSGVAASASASTAAANVPAPWTDQNIGPSLVAGYANYVSSSSTWTVAGGGSDIWNHADEFNFLSQTLTGDGSAIARVASVGYTSSSAKAGVMFRASAALNDAFVDLVIQAGGGIVMQARLASGSSAITVASAASKTVAPQWLELVRTGNTFTGYYSADGANWIAMSAPVILSLPSSALCGVAVTAHNNAGRSVSTFTNVAVAPASSDSAHVATASPTFASAAAGTELLQISSTPAAANDATDGDRLPRVAEFLFTPGANRAERPRVGHTGGRSIVLLPFIAAPRIALGVGQAHATNVKGN